ncbi:MAG: hypothetical protein JWO02_1758 [Solirubrobacterales bacterium]|nr:hypothetical protein [Solirubrobacterales bacterium]
MNKHRATRLVLAVAAGVLAGAPAAHAEVSAGSVTKTAGSVSATLSWKGGEFAVSEPRLKVSRAGTVVTDVSVADTCKSCLLVEDAAGNSADPYTILHVADLDADGEPEVLFDTYSGGAHCCITTRFFTYRPATATYGRSPSQYWGNGGYEVEDLDGDGRLELSGDDDSFAYAFSSYAASAFPPKIIRYARDAAGRSTLTDVTRRFPTVIRADAAPLLKAIRKAKPDPTHEIQGAIAAYVADQYLLGKGSVGKAELARARKRGLTAPGFQTDLLKFLKQTGYR